ncbi:MAG: ethylbenzene dehydrogenase-related protein [Cyclobacteriaceae bacterium]
MKKNTKIIFLLSFVVVGRMFLDLSSCTNEDQIIEPVEVINDETDLISVKVNAPPTVDGTVDPLWENSPKLQFSTAVPEVTGDVFRGYTANIIPSVTLRSAYDDNNIYFLAEWVDPTQSLAREPWYFDAATKRWKKESGAPAFSPTGSITRQAFYEDKFAMLWNVNNSVSGWNSGTCYKSCHTGLPASDGSSRHFTNFGTEKIDMWHWKSVRLNPIGQFDDQHQSNLYPNGRKSDSSTSGGEKSNSQTLNQPGIGDVSVPTYIIPGRTNYYWILQSEIDNSTALQVTAIDENGVLTLSDATTIDPNTDVAFQRDGSTVGAKVIPGIYTAPIVGSRGDITCRGIYTGTGWIVEYTRALKTADSEFDIDFSSLSDQYFGFSIFENAQIAHSIKPNLVLKFKK